MALMSDWLSRDFFVRQKSRSKKAGSVASFRDSYIDTSNWKTYGLAQNDV
jgi:hypothetical protein